MKVAVIGSRTLTIDLDKYLPCGITEIVSGGAKGIDMCARKFSHNNNIALTEFLPEYERYGRAAPVKRNIKIIEYSDCVIAFWDGKSKGTKSVIDYCRKIGKEITVHIINSSDDAQ